MEETDGCCLSFIEASVISTNRLAAYLKNSLRFPGNTLSFLNYFNLALLFEKK